MTTFQELIRMFEEENIALPKHKIVCPGCHGTGKHVNRAIDGHGISAHEFAEDPDFEEAYFSGAYDVRCEDCHGQNVIDEIDEEALAATPELEREWNEWLESWQETEAIYAMERRMGA